MSKLIISPDLIQDPTCQGRSQMPRTGRRDAVMPPPCGFIFDFVNYFDMNTNCLLLFCFALL